MTISRRNLLQAAALGAAFGIVGLRRKSASADGNPRAKRVLIFNASGGMRNTAAFNASSRIRFNPWGLMGVAGSVKLGNVLLSSSNVTHSAPSWGSLAPGGEIPNIRAAAASFSILGAVNHDTVGFRAGDHADEAPRMATGYYGTDAPGLGTLIWRYASANKPPLPAVSIGAAGGFGTARGEWLPYTPVQLTSYALPSGSALAPAVTLGLEDTMDTRLRRARDGRSGGMLDGYLSLKNAMRTYGPALTKPELHLNDAANADAAVDGISNRMLLEAVGNVVTSSSTGALEGVDVALAIRALQMGSPLVLTGLGGFDLHANEKQQASDIYTDFARRLAGIYFALKNIPDPLGSGSLLDTTLVVTTSEFDRSVAFDSTTGFNGGDGSDHGSSIDPQDPKATGHQAHVIFGAGIKPKALVPTDDDNLPVSGQHSTHALLSTIAAAVGTPQTAIDGVWPPGNPLYPEGTPIMDLWS